MAKVGDIVLVKGGWYPNAVGKIVYKDPPAYGQNTLYKIELFGDLKDSKYDLNNYYEDEFEVQMDGLSYWKKLNV